MVPRFSILLAMLVMGGWGSVAAPGLAVESALPGTPTGGLSADDPVDTEAALQLANQTTAQSYQLIHVHPGAGSDTQGDGTQMKPYQTITRALERAEPNTVILLAPGEYSEATGETFPLRLKPGVTVQAPPGPAGTAAVIRGSGQYLSPSQGMELVTIIAVDGSGLGNVTVVNGATQGHGLWIESGSPVIRENTFIGSGYAGIFIAGDGQPIIQHNYFHDNGVAGLVIEGASQANVQDNIFENTGTGIRVAPGAAPRIIHNEILKNQDGILLQANAQPFLQDNLIAQNRRNGIVEFLPVPQDEILSVSAPPAAAAAAESPSNSASLTGSSPPIENPSSTQNSPSAQSPSPAQSPASSAVAQSSTEATAPTTIAIASPPPATAAVTASSDEPTPSSTATTSPGPAGTELANPELTDTPEPSAGSDTMESPSTEPPSANAVPDNSASADTVVPVADFLNSEPPQTAAVESEIAQAEPVESEAAQPESLESESLESESLESGSVESESLESESLESQSLASESLASEPMASDIPEAEPLATEAVPVVSEAATVAPPSTAIVTAAPVQPEAVSTLPTEDVSEEVSEEVAEVPESAEAVPLTVIEPPATETIVGEPPASESVAIAANATPNPNNPPQIAAASPSPAPSSTTDPDTVAALRERILGRFSNPATSATSTATSTHGTRENQTAEPAPGNSEAQQGIPLQVIPPSVETLARANDNPTALPNALPLTGQPGNTNSLSAASAALSPASENALPNLPPPNEGTSDILRVPSQEIPVGNGGGDLPILFANNAQATRGNVPPAPRSRAAALGLNYRVLVTALDGATQDRVRQLVPDAFRVRVDGKVMMQAGAYSDEAEADALVAELIEAGLDAWVRYEP